MTFYNRSKNLEIFFKNPDLTQNFFPKKSHNLNETQDSYDKIAWKHLQTNSKLQFFLLDNASGSLA